MRLETARLTLIPKTLDDVRADLERMDPADRTEVSPEWIARVNAASDGDPWTFGFAISLRETGGLVGSCGFKAPPDTDGMVEIAYGLAPAHQHKGYATEAAMALVTFAFESGKVGIVRAHTREQSGASARVLERCGFQSTGSVIDREDGPVWRWEKTPD